MYARWRVYKHLRQNKKKEKKKKKKKKGKKGKKKRKIRNPAHSRVDWSSLQIC